MFLANDSTYGNASFTYPAVLAGVAGAGAGAGHAGLIQRRPRVHRKGTGNGVLGRNANVVSGSGGSGVLGQLLGRRTMASWDRILPVTAWLARPSLGRECTVMHKPEQE